VKKTFCPTRKKGCFSANGANLFGQPIAAKSYLAERSDNAKK
jgi:hypothetical protein